jgi:hypothetical protein
MHDQLRLAQKGEAQKVEEVGEVEANLWFHFAPLNVTVDKANNAIQTHSQDNIDMIILPLGDFRLDAAVEEGWYSPRYGVREKSPVAHYHGRVKLPADFILMFYPHQSAVDFQIVRTAGRAALMNFKRALAPLAAGGSLPTVKTR